ncbi:MAG TPA: hypothetical protein VF533_19315 [Solirubrobacteraceae bacterium]|jgi:hypothetical protein
MARGDGEDWLRGSAVPVGGEAPGAEDEREEIFGWVSTILVAVVVAALSDRLRFAELIGVAAGLVALTASVEWLVAPWLGRAREGGGRVAFIVLFGAVAAFAALALDGTERTVGFVVAGALFAGPVVADNVKARRRRAAGAMGAPQSPDP